MSEDDSAELRERVTTERERRGWGYTDASNAAFMKGKRLSNTHWKSYELGKTGRTKHIQEAIAAAFGWPDEWPTLPPPEEIDPLTAHAKLDRLLEAVSDGPENVAGVVREILAVVGEIRRNQTEMGAALETITRRLNGPASLPTPPAGVKRSPHRSRRSTGT